MEQTPDNQIMPEGQKQTTGFWAKLGNIFASPTKTFEALNEKPTWIAPLLILIVLSVLLTQLAFPVIINAQLDNLRNIPIEIEDETPEISEFEEGEIT